MQSKKHLINLMLRRLVLGAMIVLPASALCVERQMNLSYSSRSIRLLPELTLQESMPTGQIIFLHIPKTAGTNLDKIACSVGERNDNFHYQRLRVISPPGSPPCLITSDWLGGLQHLELNPDLLDSLPESFFLTGHFPFGLHEYLSIPAKYVTLVRHPLERELSAANFAYQRGYIDAEEFESYLTERTIDNPQVRLIAGKAYMRGPCTEETFAKAKENIERDFLLAAPSEDVDTFLQVLASNQGWGPLAYAPMQITREKVVEKLPPFLIEPLREKHKWDIELYNWVKQRWELYKEKQIIGFKPLSQEDTILTLLPDYLSNRKTINLTVGEIEEHNRQHIGNELIELEQGGSRISK